ncbi:hypothetical protein O181_125930 [Austropuccinia psidii MF-1]|uniref:Uncharacterized protein n=1 Tax=Austropuccinia psidii MF-1 TaxID=1389203 RepID=A0A9Q3KQK1_9BASI|nr:hypothetical protein [Austropuccinia psidii MF-1]
MRQSPIPYPRTSPVLTYQQLQPVTNTSRRREERPSLPFPAAQVFQRIEHFPIRAMREDSAVGNEVQDAMAKIFRSAYRNITEVIM